MDKRIRYDFKCPVVFSTGPQKVRTLIGSYIGIPDPAEADVFDLYRMDDNDEPVGEWQGRMRSAVINGAQG